MELLVPILICFWLFVGWLIWNRCRKQGKYRLYNYLSALLYIQVLFLLSSLAVPFVERTTKEMVNQDRESLRHIVNTTSKMRHLLDDMPHVPQLDQEKDELFWKYVDSIERIPENDAQNKAVMTTITKRSFKFRKYNVSYPPKYILKEDETEYFVKFGKNKRCFRCGTDMAKTRKVGGTKCICLNDFYGVDCGIPEAAWFSRYIGLYPFTKLRQRPVPRRIINAFPVNIEFDLFEARMHELYDVVDAFLIAESNYTAHGDPKELHFLKRFQRGYLANFQKKIIYVKLDYFSEKAITDGWFADSYIRTYMGHKGLPLIEGLRDDDLIILTDADELPSREIITFLKLYDGYPEPVGFGLRWNIFNFYWKKSLPAIFIDEFADTEEELCTVYSAVTYRFLTKVLSNDIFLIRKASEWLEPHIDSKWISYMNEGNYAEEWVAGTVEHYAGWHCSWCFSPRDIVKKLDSAQADDTPRWGDYLEKKNLTYIASLIWYGRWFDDQQQFLEVESPKERFYAPPYILKNPSMYTSLLFHPRYIFNRTTT